jgi:hypothetical protein
MQSFNKRTRLIGLVVTWLAVHGTVLGQDQNFYPDTAKAGSFVTRTGAFLGNKDDWAGVGYYFYASQWGSFLSNTGDGQNIFYINPTGRFVLDGPEADAKLVIHEEGTQSYGLGYQTNQFRFHLGGTASRFAFLDAPDGNARFTINSTGAIGVGTDTIPTGYLMAVKGKMITDAIGIGTATIPAGYLMAVKGKMLTDAVKIGTGTDTIPAGFLMAVKGKTIAEELQVDMAVDWPDYVFKPAYRLKPLSEVETFIRTRGHLPNIPSAQEVKQQGGIELGEMNARLLEKVEELTLYLIEAKKTREKLAAEVKALQEELRQK